MSGTQGFAGTFGISVNFEQTTGETPGKSSGPSKPKKDRRPGVEVEAELRLSRRLYDLLTFWDISKALVSRSSPSTELESAF